MVETIKSFSTYLCSLSLCLFYTRTVLFFTAALITSLKRQTLTVKLQAGFNKAVKLLKGLKGNFSGCKLQMSKCALFSATLFQDIKNTADHKS